MKFLILTILLLSCTPFIVLGETVVVTFEYDGEPLPEGYRVYLDGDQVCETDTGDVEPITCDVDAMPYGTNSFTMTAFNEGFETDHSPVYPLIKDLLVPSIINVTAKSVTININ